MGRKKMMRRGLCCFQTASAEPEAPSASKPLLEVPEEVLNFAKQAPGLAPKAPGARFAEPAPAAKEESEEDEEEEAENEDQALFNEVLRMIEIREESLSMSFAVAADDDEPRASASAPAVDADARKRRAKLGALRLQELLRQLRQRHLPEAEDALCLVAQMADHLKNDAKTLERIAAPTGRLVIVGDLHGHLNDLLRLLTVFGDPSAENQYLFNGDFVDRGDWGPEVVLSLFCLRLLHPNFVHLNRGNHEDQQCCDRYGFGSQLLHTYGAHQPELYAYVNEAFDQLPLAHVVGDAVFVVHGGLPAHPVSLDEIAAVTRGPPPRHGTHDALDAESRLFEALLWSDPGEETGPSPRGAGNFFDEELTKAFLQTNNLQRIVRSHECPQMGVDEKHGGLVTTVFSASNYGGLLDGNKARVLLLGGDCHVEPSEAWAEPYVKAGWCVKTGKDGQVRRSRDWDAKEEAERKAIETLQQRLGDDASQWSRRPQQRALEEIRRMIYLNRVPLLESFERLDSEKRGLVTPNHWAEAMVVGTGTPARFPWPALMSYVCRLQHGMVPYMEFLVRVGNPLSRELADRWCTAMIKELATRLEGHIEEEFDRLDLAKTGRVTFSELRPLIHNTIPENCKVATAQSMHVFALFRKFDPGCTGFVSRDVFVRMLEDTSMKTTRCPQGHRMDDVVPSFTIAQRTCDKCTKVIPRSNSRRHCVECDYDVCEFCSAAGQLLEVSELRNVRMGRRATLGGTKIQVQWDALDGAIRKLCQAHVDVRALFRHVDKDGDGYLERGEFVEALSFLFDGKKQLTNALWTVACEHCGSWNAETIQSKPGKQGARRRASVMELQKGEGRLRVEDFVRCVAVVELKSSAGGRRRQTVMAGAADAPRPAAATV